MYRQTIAIMALVALPANTAAAATLNVPADWPTIQQAVDHSADGDEIVVAPGIYAEHVIVDGKGPRLIRSSAGPGATTVRGSLSGSPFSVTNSTDIVIRGFTIRQGLNGIHADFDVRLVIDGNIIVDNRSADDGAGIWGVRSSIDITNNRIANNVANISGGFDGGGLYAYQMTGAVVNNVFDNNTGAEGGGMIITETSPSLYVANNLFTANHANNGGAILVYVRVNPEIRSNTFAGNTANAAGGALWYRSLSTVQFANNILANNTAPFGGGAYAADAGASAVYTCNDAWGNAGGNYAGFVGNPTGTNGNVSLDPEFCNPAAGEYTISTTSLCAPANSSSCGLIGAFGPACGTVAVRPADWSAVKRMYR